jgi:hypothetical protein
MVNVATKDVKTSEHEESSMRAERVEKEIQHINQQYVPCHSAAQVPNFNSLAGVPSDSIVSRCSSFSKLLHIGWTRALQACSR